MNLNFGFLKVRTIIPTDPQEIRKEIFALEEEARPNRFFWQVLIIILWLLRIGLPFLIFWYPFEIFLIITFIIDWIDFNPYMKIGMTQKKYNLIDKTLDQYFFGFMVAYTYWHDLFFIFLLLFLFRAIGTVLFFRSQNHLFLFWFPNLIGPAFLTLVLYEKYQVLNWTLVFLLLFLLKILEEYRLHILLNKQPLALLEFRTKNKGFKLMLNRRVDP